MESERLLNDKTIVKRVVELYILMNLIVILSLSWARY